MPRLSGTSTRKVAEKSPPMRTWASCAILQLLSAMVRATLATMPERFLPRKEMENFCTVSAQYGEMLLFGAHSRDGGAALAIIGYGRPLHKDGERGGSPILDAAI